MQKVFHGNSTGRYSEPESTCGDDGSEIACIQLRNNHSRSCTDVQTLRELHNKYMAGAFPDREPHPARQTNEKCTARDVSEKGSSISMNSSNSDANFFAQLARTRNISTDVDQFYMPRYQKEEVHVQGRQTHEKQQGKLLSNQASTNDMNHGLPNNQTDEHKFPFKTTSSGNLKVKNNQVAFDSNNISVLVADPKHTQVKIRDFTNSKSNPISKDELAMQKEEFFKNSAVNAVLKDRLGSALSSFMLGGIPGAPAIEKELSQYENKATHEILSPELTLARLGCHSYVPIEWSQITIPQKKNLYVELYVRITNFINADCKIFIDHEEFNCHLLVLQCYSEVFHTYIAVKRVDISSDKCDAPSFAFIYEWMISGDPSYTELRRGNVLEIFTAAKYLKIKDLVEQCWAFMDNRSIFSEANAFLLYIAAKRKNLPNVCHLMLPRIEKFFMMLVASEDWLYLDVDDVVTFLESNYICLNCEMEIFMAAVRWLKFDWESREKFKRQVLSCVRFGNISPWQLVDIKRNSDNPEFFDLARDPEICKMIDDGLAYVIIKYWYGQENADFKHWNSILALREPPQRNWSGVDKTYFSYREFLIHLDIFRRSLVEEQKKEQEEKEIRVTDISTQSIEKVTRLPIIGKAPTTDEFMRGSLSKSTSKKGRSLRRQLLSRLSQHEHKKKREKRKIKQADAAKIIERAYLHYKFTRSIHGLSKRLQTSYISRETDLITRFYKRKTTKTDEVKFGPQRETQVFSLSLQRGGEDIDQSSVSSSYRHRELLMDGSLYHMEHESVLIFGGINVHVKYGLGRNTGKDIYRYLPVQNDWEFVGELPAPRMHHGVGYLNGRIYIVGGSDPRMDVESGKATALDTVWSLDPVKRIWFSEGGLNTKRKNFGMVVYGKYIYAIGGQDKHSRVTNLMERYNPNSGNWEYMAPMKHARMGAACTKFEEKIWIGGGMCGSNNFPITDTVESYDIAANQWTDVTKLRMPRCFCTFTVLSNKLYVIAGAGHTSTPDHSRTSFKSIDMYVKATDTWEEQSQMEVARHGHSTAHLGTQILIIGGVTTSYMRSLRNIECYCTNRETWISGMASLPTSLTGHATCTLPPAIVL